MAKRIAKDSMTSHAILEVRTPLNDDWDYQAIYDLMGKHE